VAQEAHKTLPETARSEDAKDQEDAWQAEVTLGVASHRTGLLPEASWKGGGKQELDIAFDWANTGRLSAHILTTTVPLG
jgi:hypothetical protein